MNRVQIALWIAAASIVGSACGSDKPMKFTDGASDETAAAGRGNDETEPHVRIVSPKAGDKLTGSAEMKMDLVLPEEVTRAEFAVNGDWVEVRAPWDTLPVDTSGAENGTVTLGYRVTAKDGTVYEDSVEVEVDNPEQRLENYTLGSAIHANGETVTIDLAYSEPGLTVTVDASDLDSGFDADAVAVEDLGEGAYRVTYPISEGNTQEDGKHLVVVRAENGDGGTVENYVEVEFRSKPSIPFVVAGGSFIDRGKPGVALVPEGAPKLTSVEVNPTLVTGGTVDMKLAWEEDADNPAAAIIIASEDNSGYWTIPVDSTNGEQTIQLSLPRMAASAKGNVSNVTVTVVDNNGRAIEWVDRPLNQLIVGSGGVQISLTWDTPMDLDLHVTDPNGKLVDFATIGQGDGLLDLDSNAECEIDNINTENVFWADGREVPGEYKINVSAYAACEQAGAHYKVAAQVCGRVTTFEGDFQAADANDDPNALGREVGKVVMDCTQKVSGRVTYEKRKTISQPHTQMALSTTGDYAPARFVPVQAIRTKDKTCLARTVTDANGNYTLRFQNTGDPKFKVTAEARWGNLKPATASKPCPDFDSLASVMPLSKDTVYSAASEEQDGSSKPTITGLDLKPKMTEDSGAFSIIDVVAQGYNWVRAHLVKELPKVKVRWTRDKQTPEGGSYFQPSNSTFYIRGITSNPDEWDDIVIGHELSHFVIEKLSKSSSPGGPHSGRSVPALAWDEGLATALAADMLARDSYIDTEISSGMISCYVCVGLESSPFIEPGTSVTSGTDANRMKGKIDEFLISTILYDMLDVPNEPHDKLDSNYHHFLGSVFTYLKNAKSRGASGIDLVEYLDGWRCQDQALVDIGAPSSEADLRTLLQDATVDFPYDFAALTCK